MIFIKQFKVNYFCARFKWFKTSALSSPDVVLCLMHIYSDILYSFRYVCENLFGDFACFDRPISKQRLGQYDFWALLLFVWSHVIDIKTDS